MQTANPISVFRVEKEGPIWLTACATIHEAYTYIAWLTETAPTKRIEYLIFNHHTQHKITVTTPTFTPPKGPSKASP